MRIAFVSYEYAGHANSGGIGTYVRNAAAMMAARGHAVEVFTSGDVETTSVAAPGLLIHTVPAEPAHFADAVVPVFASRHLASPFDVVEGPEYQADAAGVAAAFPGVPLLVKLHAPRFTIDASNYHYVGWMRRSRYLAGALRRGRWPGNPWRYDVSRDPERAYALAADEIVANSRATADRVGGSWGLPKDKLSVVPYVFCPTPELLAIMPDSGTKQVVFIGKLEVRKGVLELAQAVPLVLRHDPEVRFRFVGRSLPHPEDRAPLDQHMRRLMGDAGHNAEFLGSMPYARIPSVLSEAAVCVFPSDWEASGFVCLEAMSAARGVIGSSAGGMAEIIDHGRTGLLVPPRNPKAIADAILLLIGDPERRRRMGRTAREHVLTAYSADAIAPLQEVSYARAIARAEARHRLGIAS